MPKHLMKEVELLKKKILSLSARVEESVRRATKAVEARDGGLAQKVVESDIEIDLMEVEVEEECLKVLALHQPVANDLRFIVAVLKINNDIERIGDLAVNIGERALYLSAQPALGVQIDFHEMADKVQSMLRRSLDALVNLDSAMAHEVRADDDAVDKINHEMYEEVKVRLKKHPELTDTLIHLLQIARHFERIADHATNIAEEVIYMVDGEIVRHRPEDYT